MKKITLLAAGFLIAGTVAQAQTTTSTIGGTKWGLKAGVNLAKYSFGNDDGENPETNTATNLHVTGYLDLPVGGVFSVQPGLSLQGKGGEYYDNENSKLQDNTMAIEIPVNLVAKMPIGVTGTSIFLGAGPYASYAISGQRKLDFDDDRDDIKRDLEFGNDTGDDLKAADFGINLLGGVQLNNGFNIGAGYGLGLSDLRPNGEGGNGQKNNRVLSFSVGFAF